MKAYPFTFFQTGDGGPLLQPSNDPNPNPAQDPVLRFDDRPSPNVICTRNSAGVFAFSGSDIPDASRLRLYLSPMEVEHQITGDPVHFSIQNQGSLRILARYANGDLVDPNMVDGVCVPGVLYILP